MSTRIEYELTKDDWADFGEFCARTVPEFVRVARMGIATRVVMALAASGVLFAKLHSPWVLAVGACVAVAWAWSWPRHLVSHARRHMRERKRACLSGIHAMEATPEALNAKCDITESSVRWTGISRIVTTARHVFVMLSGGQGYVVPKERIRAGNIDEFIRDAEDYLAVACESGSRSMR